MKNDCIGVFKKKHMSLWFYCTNNLMYTCPCTSIGNNFILHLPKYSGLSIFIFAPVPTAVNVNMAIENPEYFGRFGTYLTHEITRVHINI